MCETQSLQLCYRELQSKNFGQKLSSFSKQLKVCSESESSFWYRFQKHRGWRLRNFTAHENNTLLDRSKFVCTTDDSADLKHILNTTDVTESCSRERLNTKWSFYKLTNFTVMAVLLKDVPLGCNDAVLPELLLINRSQITHV